MTIVKTAIAKVPALSSVADNVVELAKFEEVGPIVTFKPDEETTISIGMDHPIARKPFVSIKKGEKEFDSALPEFYKLSGAAKVATDAATTKAIADWFETNKELVGKVERMKQEAIFGKAALNKNTEKLDHLFYMPGYLLGRKAYDKAGKKVVGVVGAERQVFKVDDHGTTLKEVIGVLGKDNVTVSKGRSAVGYVYTDEELIAKNK